MSRVNWMQVGVLAAVILVILILGILLLLVIGFGGWDGLYLTIGIGR